MFAEDIKKLTKENTNFRKVLVTGKYAQVVAMNIPAGEDIGMETHNDVDQILLIIAGKGKAILNGETRVIDEYDVIFVPAGTEHNFTNTGNEDMKLLTIYAPPQHPDGAVHKAKKEAEAYEVT